MKWVISKPIILFLFWLAIPCRAFSPRSILFCANYHLSVFFFESPLCRTQGQCMRPVQPSLQDSCYWKHIIWINLALKTWTHGGPFFQMPHSGLVFCWQNHTKVLYPFWPLIHTQTGFQVTQNRAFGKQTGWRLTKNSVYTENQVLACLFCWMTFLACLFMQPYLLKQHWLNGRHNQNSASFNLASWI